MTLGLVLAVGLVPFVWGDVLTHTADTVVTTAKEVWPPLGGAHSVDASDSPALWKVDRVVSRF